MKFIYCNVYLLIGHNRLVLGEFKMPTYKDAIRLRTRHSSTLKHLGVVQICRHRHHKDTHVCFYPNKSARCILPHLTAQFK